METTTYILGTYDKRKAPFYGDILNSYGITKWNENGDPIIVEAREKLVWFVDHWRTYYSFKAEVYRRDVKDIRRLVKNTQYPSSYIAWIRNFKEKE